MPLDLGEIWKNTKKFFSDNKEMIVDVGMGLGKAWVDMSDQERKTAVNEKAYNDYMKQVEAAGQEAESAVALNLTPMEITNVPTTKADVSDFTLVGAKGGLMTLPTKQRKRYAYGPNEIDVEAMQEESIGPYELQMEEGVNIGPMVEEDKQKQLLKAFAEYQAGGGTLSLQEFAVMWIEENAARTVEGDTQMASAPGIPGIEGLRHGGRPGYQFGVGPQQGMMPQGMMPPQGLMPQQGLRPGYQEGVGPLDININDSVLGTSDYQGGTTTSDVINQKETSSNNVQSMASSFLKGGIMDTEEALQTAMMIDAVSQEQNFDQSLVQALIEQGLSVEDALKKAITIAQTSSVKNMKKGGRIKKAPGGIMDLGGLEKDYRTSGGFVPIGGRERADDVPARLSKNEFVMTADAVRAAGGGSINRGAQRMYNTMKHLEANPQSRRMIS